MCTQPLALAGDADGAGHESAPVVVYVSRSPPPGEGSQSRSPAGRKGARAGAVVGGGWAARRRVACVIVGWNRPPSGEWFSLCVGWVWPRMKMLLKCLFFCVWLCVSLCGFCLSLV